MSGADFKAAVSAAIVANHCLAGSLMALRAIGQPETPDALFLMSEAAAHAKTLARRLQDAHVILAEAVTALAGLSELIDRAPEESPP